MSKRDWLLAGCVLTIIILIAVIWNCRRDAEPAVTKSAPTPTRAKSEDLVLLEDALALSAKPQEEKAMGYGLLAGEELGAERTQLSSKVIQDAIYKYNKELVVEPEDVLASCIEFRDFDEDAPVDELAARLGVKRSFILGLMATYVQEAPRELRALCLSAGMSWSEN